MQMRLNLGCLTETVRKQGYINIDDIPSTEENKDIYKQGSFESLDWLCENETVEEIIIKDSIGRIPLDALEGVLQNCAQKLQPGGILKIITPVEHLVAQMFFQEQMSLVEYQRVVLGTQYNNIQMRSLLDIPTLIGFLEQAGLSVILKRYDGLCLYVEAVKT